MVQTYATEPKLATTNLIQIEYSQLNGQTRLHDNDRIAVQVTTNVCPEAYIQIGLRLGPGLTWWKGIELDEIVMAQCQDTQVYALSQVAYDEFKKRHLNLWKAKFFGVHTPMYTVADALGPMEAGNLYVFEWLQDT